MHTSLTKSQFCCVSLKPHYVLSTQQYILKFGHPVWTLEIEGLWPRRYSYIPNWSVISMQLGCFLILLVGSF